MTFFSAQCRLDGAFRVWTALSLPRPSFPWFFRIYPRKIFKTPRISLAMRTLNNPLKQTENTQADQGSSQQEKHQGNKKTKEKKDRVWSCLAKSHFWMYPFKMSPFRPPEHRRAFKSGKQIPASQCKRQSRGLSRRLSQ